MPTNQPSNPLSKPPSGAAEKIMQTQQEILTLLRSLVPSNAPGEGEPQENSTADALVATMVELLQRILTAVNLQRDLMEAILGMIRGGPGAEAALNEVLRRSKG